MAHHKSQYNERAAAQFKEQKNRDNVELNYSFFTQRAEDLEKAAARTGGGWSKTMLSTARLNKEIAKTLKEKRRR